MLKVAGSKDQEQLELWLKANWENGASRRYPFDMKHAYISYLENQIHGFALVVPKVITLHDQRLKTSYITDVSLSKDEFDSLIHKVGQESLVTLLKTPDPVFYESCGFETIMENIEYNVNAIQLPQFSVEGIVLDPKEDALRRVYQSFTQHFNGYFERDADYFKQMKSELQGKQGGIIGFSEEGVLSAYIAYETQGNAVYVREYCFMRSGQLMRLLSFVTRGKSRLILNASPFEQMQKLFPDVKKEKKHFLMARINNKKLFEKLYHIKIISAYSGFHAFGKALWNRDYY